MKYLKIIIFACIVLQTTFTFSQSDFLDCGFVPDASMYNTSKYSATVKSDFSTDEPIVFNVNYHILNHSDGTNPDGITEEHLLESIALLNINFNKYNIFYKYRGFEEYNDDNLYSAALNTIVNTLNLQENFSTSINIILTRPLPQAIASIGSQRVIAPAFALTSSVQNIKNSMVHEFGHLAGLFHTFNGTDFSPRCFSSPTSEFCIDNDTECQTNADLDGDNIPDVAYAPPRLNTPNFYEVGQTDYGFVENVTRDINDSNFNADVKGDMVVDTPASYLGSQHSICSFYNGDINFIPHSTIIDEVGQEYINIDIQNFMSYAEITRTHFTNGQGVRMRETILDPNNTQFEPRMTEVDSLYEPYKNDYFNVGSILPNHRTLFQPGFDYIFTQCGGTQQNYGMQIYNTPSDYDNVSFIFSTDTHAFGYSIDKFSLDFNNITHINHSAIFIQQLNVDNLENGGQPHKCYNNFNRSSIGGAVIKFEDGVPNTNITLYIKNESEINDENLIQDLENGLYIIKKNFEDGSQEQKTILKNDN